MSKYQVSANGAEFGIYEAEDEQGARDACAQDAGYKSEADMEAQLEQPSELIAEPATRFVFQHNGFDFKLVELSEGEMWSLTALVDCEEDVDGLWPSDEALSKIAGCDLRFFDAGDDPKYPECILAVVKDD